MVLTYINQNNYLWNPWYGCFKISEACANCYIKNVGTFEDQFYSINEIKLASGNLIAVGTHTDFFLENADHLRNQAWDVIRSHPQVIFEIYTKRVERIVDCLPEDWGDGWDNVIFCVTVENQKRADERIPILGNLKCKHKWLNCAPLLSDLDLNEYLKKYDIESITTSGERRINGNVRPTHFEWVQNLSEQCKLHNIHFEVMFLGHKFILTDGQIIEDYSKCFQSALASELKLNNYVPITFNI